MTQLIMKKKSSSSFDGLRFFFGSVSGSGSKKLKKIGSGLVFGSKGRFRFGFRSHKTGSGSVFGSGFHGTAVP